MLLGKFALLLPSLLAVLVGGTTTREHCIKKAIDVVFVLDASGSIKQSDFESEKTFVRNVIGGLDIGSGAADVRVALVTFSTGPHIIFDFNANVDVGSAQHAVDAASFIGGSTAIGSALDLVRTSLLADSSRGYRGGEVAVIVISDGNTLEDPADYAASVNAIKRLAQIYAVGVGRVDSQDLGTLASSPDNAIALSSFTELSSSAFAKNTLEAVACDVCTYKNVDIAFILDASGSITSSKFDQIKQFAADLVSYLFVGQDDSRVAVIRYSTGAKVVLDFDDSYDADSIRNTILNILRVGASTATGVALDLFSSNLASPSSGHRSSAELVSILITDGQTLEPYDEFLPAVDRFHATGVTSFVFGIGRTINVNELTLIASAPAQSHVLLVDNLSTLSAQQFVRSSVSQVVCVNSGSSTAAPSTQAAATTAAATTAARATTAEAEEIQPTTAVSRETPSTTARRETTAPAATEAATAAARATTVQPTTAQQVTSAPTTIVQATTVQATTVQATTVRATAAPTTTQATTTAPPADVSLTCRRRTADLIIALDASTGLGPGGWDSAVQFANNLIFNAKVASDATHVAIVVYSSTASIMFDFRYSYNGDFLRTQLGLLKFEGQAQSRPSEALSLIAERLLVVPGQSGYRGVAATVVFLTGPTHDDTFVTLDAAARRVRSLGADLFALSVGALSTEQAEAIADEPLATHASNVRDYAALDDPTFLGRWLGNILCYAEPATRPPVVTPTPSPEPVFSTTPDVTRSPPNVITTTTEAASTPSAGPDTRPADSATPATPLPIRPFACINGRQNGTGSACVCDDSLCTSCVLAQDSSLCLNCAGGLIKHHSACVGQCPPGFSAGTDSDGSHSCVPVCSFVDSDIVVLVDSSSSVGVQDFGLSVRLARDVLGLLPLGDPVASARVAFVNFAEDVAVDFMLSDHASLFDLRQLVTSSAFQGGATSIGKALTVAKKIFSNSFTGARGVRSSILLLTDGQSSDDVTASSQELKAMGVEIFVGVVGLDSAKDRVTAIASAPASTHVFALTPNSIDDLPARLIPALSCGQPAVSDEPAETHCVNGTLLSTSAPCSCGIGCTSCSLKGGLRTCTAVAKCAFDPYDLVILLDASQNLGEIQFHFALSLARNVIGALPIGLNDVRVALVSYAEDTNVTFTFARSFDDNVLLSLASHATYQGGVGDLAQALNAVHSRLLWSSASGSRGGRFRVLLLGNGPATAASVAAAASLRADGAEIFAVGMGVNNISALVQLSGQSQAVFVVQDVDMLQDAGFAGIVVSALHCDTAVAAPLTTPAAPLDPTKSPFLEYSGNDAAGHLATSSPTEDPSGSGSGQGDSQPGHQLHGRSLLEAQYAAADSLGSAEAEMSRGAAAPSSGLLVVVLGTIGAVVCAVVAAVVAVRLKAAAAGPVPRHLKKKTSDLDVFGGFGRMPQLAMIAEDTAVTAAGATRLNVQ